MKSFTGRTVRHGLLYGAISLAMGACATNHYDSTELPEPVQPAFQLPADQQINAGGEVVSRWWDTLEDVQLSSLVDQALQHNNDIDVALANLELARTAVKADSLQRFPDVSASVSAAEQRLADNQVAPGADSRFTSYEAGFDAFWELDLFGRLGDQVAASRAELEATQADLDQAYVTVAAEVARTYIELRGAQHRLDVGLRNVQTLEQSYELTRELMEAGLGDNLNVQRSLTQLELARASLPLLNTQVDVSINRLSVLTGQMPAVLRQQLAQAQPLPTIPPTINVGDPLDLLKRRPDIRSAERRLASSISSYDMSVAELYPRVSITGMIGFVATRFADLGTGGTLTHLVAPQISWDAFNFGRVQNQVAAADARVQVQLARFEQTLLTSFEEVDNAMTTLAREAERRERLAAAAEASARSSQVALERFEAGADSFLDVLDAQRTQLSAEDMLASSETTLALNVISLYKALGGGWQLQ